MNQKQIEKVLAKYLPCDTNKKAIPFLTSEATSHSLNKTREHLARNIMADFSYFAPRWQFLSEQNQERPHDEKIKTASLRDRNGVAYKILTINMGKPGPRESFPQKELLTVLVNRFHQHNIGLSNAKCAECFCELYTVLKDDILERAKSADERRELEAFFPEWNTETIRKEIPHILICPDLAAIETTTFSIESLQEVPLVVPPTVAFIPTFPVKPQ